MEHRTARRFSDEEMELARNVDLPELLSSMGYRVKRIGSYHTTEEMDSLRIKNRRTWVRYSDGRGGDAITFLQQFEGKSFPEAVEQLLAFQGQGRPFPAKTERVAERHETPAFELPEAHIDARRVYAYLRKRGISSQVINRFVNNGLLYEDAKYHNCVFVGRDSGGTPKFASKRSTFDLYGKSYKGDVLGSDKNIGFPLPVDKSIDSVKVFEAPIDLMSYLTLNPSVKVNAVALCGVYDGALKTFLKENPSIKGISLCVDSDEPGKAAAEKMMAEYEKNGYSVSREMPPRGKDWNEYLQYRQRAQERGR